MTTTLKPRSFKRSTDVPAIRAAIVAFLQTKPEGHLTDKGTIAEHLGRRDPENPYACDGYLDQALRSRRIYVTKVHPHIGTWPDGQPIHGATPIHMYSARP